MNTELSDGATHILVVEDEENLRRILVRNLEQRGYHVSEARTVAWAVDVSSSDLPDVLVLDINLPDGSGWDVLRQLAARGVPHPPVVAISAVPQRQAQLAQFVPVTFLLKPFLIDALLRAVDHAAAKGHTDEPLDHPAL
jgi:DNA-binding response OmpR family regulator